ncbi:hypothetical protein APY04_2173 [Hyphomicrobium sulfonivorans]|uniref:Uncharacterized protein n=1 Tax=Hyphomicrobium sulfonivorans TaxID=121290 RepID=A0A109BDI7_HYPSL|nr:hypothetical protein APY04_2173 [Hyphomicrobium sulfonivorans]
MGPDTLSRPSDRPATAHRHSQNWRLVIAELPLMHGHVL